MAYTRKKEKGVFVLCGIFIGITLASIVASGYLVLNQNPIEVKREEPENTQKEICLVTKEEIKKGSPIQEGQFIAKKVDTHLTPENRLSFSEKINVMVSAIDIEPNTILTESMFVLKDAYVNDARYQDYSDIRLPLNLMKGDTVDIRIKRKAGDDYIVLSKKEIVERANNTVWIMIDELERMRMNQAILEFKNEMAELYTTEYINKIDQYAPSVTYLR